MVSKNRRAILKYSLFTPILGFCPALALLKANNDEHQVKNELAVVLDQWLDKMKCLPSEYIKDTGIDITQKALINERSVADFRAGETISINGLILSKNEAAILAEFAVLVLT